MSDKCLDDENLTGDVTAGVELTWRKLVECVKVQCQLE